MLLFCSAFWSSAVIARGVDCRVVVRRVAVTTTSPTAGVAEAVAETPAGEAG